MPETDWYVKHLMSCGQWAVLRTRHSIEKPLDCERYGYQTKSQAEQALRNELRARYTHAATSQERAMPTPVMLSEHFSLAEFTYSQNAARAGVPNTPSPEALSNLHILAGVMEEVREVCGGHPVTITSGYRNEQVNDLCGGAVNSAHISGLACDFIIPAYGTPLDICKILEPFVDTLKIDQLIHEYGDWVHLGLASNPEEARNDCLTINNSGTTTGFA